MAENAVTITFALDQEGVLRGVDEGGKAILDFAEKIDDLASRARAAGESVHAEFIEEIKGGLADGMREAGASAEEIAAVLKEVDDAAGSAGRGLHGAGEEAKKTGEQLGGAGREGEKAGEGFKKSGDEAEEAGKKFKESSGGLKEWVQNALGLDAVFRLWDRAKGIAGGVADFFAGGIGDLTAMKDINAETGASIDMLSRWSIAMKAADVSGREFGLALRGMGQAMTEAGQAGSKSGAVMRALGIDMGEFKKLGMEDQFKRLGAAVASIEDPLLRQQAAVELFGRGYRSVLRLFADGEEEIDGFIAYSEGLAKAIDENIVTKADDVADAWEKLDAGFGAIKQGFFVGLVNELAPFLDQLSTKLLPVFRDLIASSRGFGAAVGEALSAVIPYIEQFSARVKEVGFWEAFKEEFMRLQDWLANQYAELGPKLTPVATSVGQTIGKAIVSGIQAALAGLADSTSDTLKDWANRASNILWGGDIASSRSTTERRLADTLAKMRDTPQVVGGIVNPDYANLAAQARNYNTQLNAMAAAQSGASSGGKILADTTDKVAEAAKGAGASTDKLTSSQDKSGGAADSSKRNYEGLAGALSGAAGASSKAAGELARLQASIAILNNAAAAGGSMGDAMREAAVAAAEIPAGMTAAAAATRQQVTEQNALAIAIAGQIDSGENQLAQMDAYRAALETAQGAGLSYAEAVDAAAEAQAKLADEQAAADLKSQAIVERFIETQRKLREEQRAAREQAATAQADVTLKNLDKQVALQRAVQDGLIGARDAQRELNIEQQKQQLIASGVRDNVDALATRMVDAQIELEKLQETGISLGDTLRDAFNQTFDAIIAGTRSLEDVWEGIGLSLAKSLFDTTLKAKFNFDNVFKGNILDLGSFANSVFGNIFGFAGGGGGSGSGGGIFDAILGLFGGGSGGGGSLLSTAASLLTGGGGLSGLSNFVGSGVGTVGNLGSSYFTGGGLFSGAAWTNTFPADQFVGPLLPGGVQGTTGAGSITNLISNFVGNLPNLIGGVIGGYAGGKVGELAGNALWGDPQSEADAIARQTKTAVGAIIGAIAAVFTFGAGLIPSLVGSFAGSAASGTAAGGITGAGMGFDINDPHFRGLGRGSQIGLGVLGGLLTYPGSLFGMMENLIGGDAGKALTFLNPLAIGALIGEKLFEPLLKLIFSGPTEGTLRKRAGESVLDRLPTFSHEGGLQDPDQLGDLSRKSSRLRNNPGLPDQRERVGAAGLEAITGFAGIFSQLMYGGEDGGANVANETQTWANILTEFFSRIDGESEEVGKAIKQNLASAFKDLGVDAADAMGIINELQVNMRASANPTYFGEEVSNLANLGAAVRGTAAIFESELPPGIHIAALAMESMSKDGVKFFGDLDKDGKQTLVNLSKDAENFDAVLAHLFEQGFTIDTDEFKQRLEDITASAEYLGKNLGSILSADNLGQGIDGMMQDLGNQVTATFRDGALKQLFDKTNIAAAFEPVFNVLNRMDEFDLTAADGSGSKAFMDEIVVAIAQGKANLSEWLPQIKAVQEAMKEVQEQIDEALKPTDAEANWQWMADLLEANKQAAKDFAATLFDAAASAEAMMPGSGKAAARRAASSSIDQSLRGSAVQLAGEAAMESDVGQEFAAAKTGWEATFKAAMKDGVITAAEEADLTRLRAKVEEAGKGLADSMADGAELIGRMFSVQLEVAKSQVQDALGGAAGSMFSELSSEKGNVDSAVKAFGESFRTNIASSVFAGMQEALVQSAMLEGALAPLMAQFKTAVSTALADGVITADEQGWLDSIAKSIGVATDKTLTALEPTIRNLAEVGETVMGRADKSKDQIRASGGDIVRAGEEADKAGDHFRSAGEGAEYYRRTLVGGADTVDLSNRDLTRSNEEQVGRRRTLQGQEEQTSENAQESTKSLADAMKEALGETDAFRGGLGDANDVLTSFIDVLRKAVAAGGGSTTDGGSSTPPPEEEEEGGGRQFPGSDTSNGSGRGFPRAATGGTFARGSAIVGEAGMPELVTALPGGGFTVDPLSWESATALMGGGVPGYADGTGDRAGSGRRFPGSGRRDDGRTPPGSAPPPPPAPDRREEFPGRQFPTKGDGDDGHNDYYPAGFAPRGSRPRGWGLGGPNIPGGDPRAGRTPPIDLPELDLGIEEAFEKFLTGGTLQEFGRAVEEAMGDSVMEGVKKGMLESGPVAAAVDQFQKQMEAATEKAMRDGVVTAQEQADLEALAEKLKKGVEDAAAKVKPMFEALSKVFGDGIAKETTKALGDLPIGDALLAALQGGSLTEMGQAIDDALYGSITSAITNALLTTGPLAEMIQEFASNFGDLIGVALEDGTVNQRENNALTKQATEFGDKLKEKMAALKTVLGPLFDQFADLFGQTTKRDAAAVGSVLSNAMRTAVTENQGFDEFAKNAKAAVFEQVSQGLIDAFVNSLVIQGLLAGPMGALQELFRQIGEGQLKVGEANVAIAEQIGLIVDALNSEAFKKAWGETIDLIRKSAGELGVTFDKARDVQGGLEDAKEASEDACTGECNLRRRLAEAELGIGALTDLGRTGTITGGAYRFYDPAADRPTSALGPGQRDADGLTAEMRALREEIERLRREAGEDDPEVTLLVTDVNGDVILRAASKSSNKAGKAGRRVFPKGIVK